MIIFLFFHRAEYIVTISKTVQGQQNKDSKWEGAHDSVIAAAGGELCPGSGC